MGTIRMMNAESSKAIGVYLKCQYCENENFQLQKITARGSAQANGIPWGKEAQAEQTSRLQETAKSAANTNLEILEQKYEKSVNQYRRLWGIPLLGECQKCGEEQIWNQLESIHYGKIQMIIFVVGSIMCRWSNMGKITVAWLFLLLSLFPVTYIIHQGMNGFQKVKKLQNLDQRYYPIIVTPEKLHSFLAWKNNFANEHPVIESKNTKSSNKPMHVILQMIKSICLIWGITSLLIGEALDYNNHQIKVPVEYQQYDYMSEDDQYVFFDATSMVKIGREILSINEYDRSMTSKVYFYLVDEKGNQGIASMHSSEASEEFRNSFYNTSIEDTGDYYSGLHRLYGKTRSAYSDEIKELGLPEDIPILEVSKEMTYVMVDDPSHLNIGKIVSYIGIVFIIVFVILKIREKLNEKKMFQ